MSKISSFSVKKPITIIMSILIVIILGFVSLANLTTDLLPSINLPYAVVSTSYFGASPETIEQMITKPIENSMATVSNIKNVQSISQENMSMVILEFNEDTNMDSALVEIREKLDMITTYMPSEVGNPMILKINPDMMPIMNFSLSVMDKEISELTFWFESVIVPRIERIPGVASVTLTGTAKNEIQVKLNNEKIESLNQKISQSLPTGATSPKIKITEEMISGILKGQNFSMPTGYINQEGTDYLVRVGDKLKDLEELKTLPIMSNPLITITLQDVADINMVDISEESYSKVNGIDAVMISIQKQNNYATTDVAELVEEELAKINEEFENVETVMLMNQADYINDSVRSVTNNLLYGAILAVIILFIFLRDLKPTIIIALAIPISVMSAFIMIYFSKMTLNIISMGGLALGIGMLVDNSIVVIENIYRLRNEGVSAKEAAIKGAHQVAGAITASTLTTVSVFAPVIFMKGITAEIFKEMALTISFSLIASLIIALTLVPMMASKIMKNSQINKQHRVLDGIKKVYTRMLKFSLKHKITVILLALVLFIGSIYGSLKIGAEFFPESDQGQIMIDVTMPVGSEFEDAAQMLDKLSEIIGGIEDVDTVGASLGGDMMFAMMRGSDSASMNVLLAKDRSRTTKEIAQEIREATANLECEVSVSEAGMNMGGMGGSGISIMVKGYDVKKLENIAKDIAGLVESTEGTTEINNGISKTSPELKITVDREKSIEKGLTNAQVFMAVKDAISEDNKISKLALNGQEYDISVYDDISSKEEMDIEGIKNLTIEPPMGTKVKVSDVATVGIEKGYASIRRHGQTRYITVTAKIKDGYNVGLVGNDIEEKINDYDVEEGFTVELQGEQEEIRKSFTMLLYALLLAIVLIYMVMASQFQSLLYPFIVMFSIPLAFTGGFLGLFITNTPVSVVALIGLIILAGIVVNNGIVIVDYINQLKEEGKSTYDAVIEAGNTRFRPIIMTALTTIIALSTMALGVGENAEMMQPMAITAIGGLIYATLLTLIIIPVIYTALDRLRKKRV
ncbi:efflux RND transporter permease subunit [Oceanirhabdus sp. W0125-5]|uniref:efflux RND transporter permease subunit n=1 Tax=Oceanirhabdus sp. W0125-5 TaxID=2999116 RepID=UPI0022F2EDF4|nr:efflux RND transporter permease subunit [Oceanirhabdus sp. W0125-5]WBW99109.1 efflux RND transporter permease subunit [Oceanirhabdus sp. W0125-5]